MRVKYDGGIKDDVNYGPSLQLDKGTEMVSSENMKVKIFSRAYWTVLINSSCVVAGDGAIVARQDKKAAVKKYSRKGCGQCQEPICKDCWAIHIAVHAFLFIYFWINS